MEVRRHVVRAAIRAIILGAVVTIAISVSAALREPVATPEGERAVRAWLAPVPEGWPASPWPTARHDSAWARERWELRGDPPRTPTGRARDFAAQWSIRCGWPLPAFKATRNRLRSLWGQGETFRRPSDGPSDSLSEGVVIAASSIGGVEGQYIVPVTPIALGFVVDSIVWAVPFFALSLVTLRRRQRENRLRAAPPVPTAPPRSRN